MPYFITETPESQGEIFYFRYCHGRKSVVYFKKQNCLINQEDYRDECYGYVVLGYDFGNSEIDFAVYDNGRGLRLVNFCVF